MRIVVTGGSGKAGRWVVRDLRERGHDVLNVDLVRDSGPHGTTLAVDLTDLGQCHDVIAGADAVVHLAAIPAPGLRPEGETFRNNILSTYNVFSAAAAHRVSRLVWASSETVLGLPFDTPPLFAPIDETIEPRPETSYALAKLLGEEMVAAAPPEDRDPGRQPAHLEHHGAGGLRGLPGLLGGRPAAEVEPLELRGREGRGAVGAPGARGRPSTAPRCASSPPPTTS